MMLSGIAKVCLPEIQPVGYEAIYFQVLPCGLSGDFMEEARLHESGQALAISLTGLKILEISIF